MCEVEAPGVFSVPKTGTVQVMADITPDNEADVRSAIRHCPSHALSLTEI